MIPVKHRRPSLGALTVTAVLRRPNRGLMSFSLATAYLLGESQQPWLMIPLTLAGVAFAVLTARDLLRLDRQIRHLGDLPHVLQLGGPRRSPAENAKRLQVDGAR